ncbi:MAG: diaminopimelate epimerase [Firmicutes bacterium]|nr:diaminopimelate epimerase [Bacillota bacterium]
MKFHKYHALGNDYIVIDPRQTKIKLTSENIKTICHRNFGVGSDGILYGPLTDTDQIALKIYNPDGSEAEKSGNGIRIFSRYLFDQKYITGKSFVLQTLGGKVFVEFLDDQGSMIKVDMGTVTFQSNLIPVNGPPREMTGENLEINKINYQVTCLSIGNPHCVIPLPEISREKALEIGPLVENHPLFPNRINMQLLKVLDRGNIQIEIWERGAGYTMASGSSSCAAASAAYKLGLVDNLINVHMPGGIINIDIKPDGHVFMTGSVVKVYSGEMAGQFLEQIDKF